MNTLFSNMNKYGDFLQMDHSYKCDVPGCGNSYRKAFELLAHKRWHDKKCRYVCKLQGCEMSFKYWTSLNSHMKIHTGERPYLCDVCKKNFPRKDSLKEHLKIHSRKVSCIE
jgi:uncharacterized Zn-finger protein